MAGTVVGEGDEMTGNIISQQWNENMKTREKKRNRAYDCH
jgi:hypothetical protein